MKRGLFIFLIMSLILIYSDCKGFSQDEEAATAGSANADSANKEETSVTNEAATKEETPTPEEITPQENAATAPEASVGEEKPVAETVPADTLPEKEKLVKIIRVKGNKVISTASVLSKIKSKPAEKFSSEILNDDLKRLYTLGYFTDVAIDIENAQDGVIITFVVEERPLVSKIEFKGNKFVRTANLQKLMKIKEGELLNYTQLNEDMQEMKKFYEKKGFPATDIKYETAVDEKTNETKLVINIEEKAKLRIKDIKVEGNKAFPTKRLLNTISTKKGNLFRSGYLKEEEFEEDIKKIKDLYNNSGYLDAEITPERSYSDDGKFLFITIKINEGKKYLVGSVSMKGNMLFPEQEIREKLGMVKDSPFSHQGLRNDIFGIQQYYYHKGYMFAQIDAETIFNESTGMVDIVYKIVENELTYVDKIKIKGNTKTKDVVIRRELRVYPGERFDGDKIRRSKERLYNLGFFEEVNFDTEPSEQPNKQNLLVEVKEAKTGEFSFGAGYSSIDQVIGFVEIVQKNFDLMNVPDFTGDGQRLRMKAQLGTVRRDYEIGWLEPWIFDYPLAFGTDVYQRTHQRTSKSGYGFDETRRGFDLTLGKEFTEYTKGDLIYKFEDVRISDVPSESSVDLKSEEGTNTLSTAEFALTHDMRDNVYNPTKGYLLRGSIENAGGVLGADKDFLKYIGMGSIYFTHFTKLLLELRTTAAVANAYGNTAKVPIYERYYAGGTNTIRGYRERGVGPKDLLSGDAIGGNALLVATAEYTFPVITDVIKGAVFYDIGNVWEKMSDFGTGGYKSGAGLGVRVKTPIGPVKVDYGYPLNDIPGDKKKGKIYFTISQGF
ncbi:MAG: outer membrane protein assembly factor BamA [Candidatus Omnitrophica bacterium CG07_land_8_20_14_0_80_42_15]|uniref:Outer membrane protein assembly factor BamA n=1 Tax=Candidatus Aquitaenariimonas noxiae TaxID=1974741 RepID=A0A2J0KUU5_9BACT|nr:MAG: outer membrane protein assembly factor BamA [Candidatus Omnitrophica bacterium CG07_land_8_20_14_0_80_42_15]